MTVSVFVTALYVGLMDLHLYKIIEVISDLMTYAPVLSMFCLIL